MAYTDCVRTFLLAALLLATPAAGAEPQVTGNAMAIDKQLDFPLPAGDAGASGRWDSGELTTGMVWHQAVITWNAKTPPGATLSLEVAARRAGRWSDWFPLARWLGSPPPIRGSGRRPKTEAEPKPPPDDSGVALDVDTLVAKQPGADALRCRVIGSPAPDGRRAQVERLAVTITRLARADAGWGAVASEADLARSDAWTPESREGGVESPPIALDVPFRSQTVEAKTIRSRICCPTSLAMVLEWHGVARPTLEVARRCLDTRNGIFGNWSFAAAAASEFGLPARVTRMRGWRPVTEQLALGRPVIASISFGKGELDGSPIENGTSGHLVVIRGISNDGRILVNDPAGKTAREGQVAYPADQLLRAWRNGAAILVEGPVRR